MAQIMGKSMRFVIHVPLSTGRDLVKWAKEVGMNEAAFVSAALVIGGRSMHKSDQLISQLTAAQAAEFGKLALVASARDERRKLLAKGQKK